MATKTPEQKAADKAAKEAAKKTEALTDGLKAAGVELTGKETPEEIQALAEKNGVKVLSPEEAAAAKKAAGASKGGPITVTYRNHRGEAETRTFSKEVHGDDFVKLADEFKANPNNRVIE